MKAPGFKIGAIVITLIIAIFVACSLNKPTEQNTESNSVQNIPFIENTFNSESNNQDTTSNYTAIPFSSKFMVGEEARLFLEKNSYFPDDVEIAKDSEEPPVILATYPNACFVLYAPWMPQVPPGDWDNTKNCGQASSAMIGGYYHNYCPSSAMITGENSWLRNYTGDTRYLQPNGWYTGASTLPPLLRSYHGLSVNVYYGHEPDDVVWDGYRGHPVIVAVKTRMGVTTGVAHYMVFVGFSYPYMYFHDPGRSTPENGRFVAYTVTQFYNSWNTQGRQYMPVLP